MNGGSVVHAKTGVRPDCFGSTLGRWSQKPSSGSLWLLRDFGHAVGTGHH